VKKKSSKAKSVRSLPAKTLSARNAKGVKGGGENFNLNYGQIKWTYTTQEDRGGSVEKK